eukprot:jgi/Botrbrau1/3367/Bobra.0337s0008.1
MTLTFSPTSVHLPGRGSVPYTSAELLKFELDPEEHEGKLVLSHLHACPIRSRRPSLWPRQGSHVLASLTLALGKGKEKRDSQGSEKDLQQPESKEELNAGPTFRLLEYSTCKGREEQRFVWDGTRIRAVDVDQLKEGNNTSSVQWQQRLRRLNNTIFESLFPEKEAVTPDYWEYVRWRGLHRVFSSVMQNFATQSLLLAVGVGKKGQETLPMAAAINWILKEGLGRLGRLSVAARFGQSFDADLKRFRFATSLLVSGSFALEYLTPHFRSTFFSWPGLLILEKASASQPTSRLSQLLGSPLPRGRIWQTSPPKLRPSTW